MTDRCVSLGEHARAWRAREGERGDSERTDSWVDGRTDGRTACDQWLVESGEGRTDESGRREERDGED